MLDLRQFQALCAIDSARSSAAAARKLGWSQPTVAHHLNALARVTGAAVVYSTSAGTFLTDAGQLWLPHARAIVDRADYALSDVLSSLESRRRTVRLGVFPTAAPRFLPLVVARFAAVGIDIRVTEAELVELVRGLRNLQLDAAIVYSAPGASRSSEVVPNFSPLFTEKFSVALPAAHSLVARPSLDLGDLRNERWIVGENDDDPVERAFREATGNRGYSPLIGQRTDNYSVVIEYVAAGLGVALVPALALPANRADIRVPEIGGLDIARQVGLEMTPTLDATTRAILLEALDSALAEPGAAPTKSPLEEQSLPGGGERRPTNAAE